MSVVSVNVDVAAVIREFKDIAVSSITSAADAVINYTNRRKEKKAVKLINQLLASEKGGSEDLINMFDKGIPYNVITKCRYEPSELDSVVMINHTCESNLRLVSPQFNKRLLVSESGFFDVLRNIYDSAVTNEDVVEMFYNVFNHELDNEINSNSLMLKSITASKKIASIDKAYWFNELVGKPETSEIEGMVKNVIQADRGIPPVGEVTKIFSIDIDPNLRCTVCVKGNVSKNMFCHEFDIQTVTNKEIVDTTNRLKMEETSKSILTELLCYGSSNCMGPIIKVNVMSQLSIGLDFTTREVIKEAEHLISHEAKRISAIRNRLTNRLSKDSNIGLSLKDMQVLRDGKKGVFVDGKEQTAKTVKERAEYDFPVYELSDEGDSSVETIRDVVLATKYGPTAATKQAINLIHNSCIASSLHIKSKGDDKNIPLALLKIKLMKGGENIKVPDNMVTDERKCYCVFEEDYMVFKRQFTAGFLAMVSDKMDILNGIEISQPFSDDFSDYVHKQALMLTLCEASANNDLWTKVSKKLRERSLNLIRLSRIMQKEISQHYDKSVKKINISEVIGTAAEYDLGDERSAELIRETVSELVRIGIKRDNSLLNTGCYYDVTKNISGGSADISTIIRFDEPINLTGLKCILDAGKFYLVCLSKGVKVLLRDENGEELKYTDELKDKYMVLPGARTEEKKVAKSFKLHISADEISKCLVSSDRNRLYYGDGGATCYKIVGCCLV